MREVLPFDIKRLKEEDRRFLLNRNLSETISNYQGSMSNIAITLSLLALSIAGFSLVYQTKILWLILIYSTSSMIGLIFYIKKYKKAQNDLALERIGLKINYDELFKYHLAYSDKKKK